MSQLTVSYLRSWFTCFFSFLFEGAQHALRVQQPLMAGTLATGPSYKLESPGGVLELPTQVRLGYLFRFSGTRALSADAARVLTS